jgi:hypothetical protein
MTATLTKMAMPIEHGHVEIDGSGPILVCAGILLPLIAYNE